MMGPKTQTEIRTELSAALSSEGKNPIQWLEERVAKTSVPGERDVLFSLKRFLEAGPRSTKSDRRIPAGRVGSPRGSTPEAISASAWSSGNGSFGIRISYPNRQRFFKKAWKTVSVEIDGNVHKFTLTPGFWKKCPEFRDAGAPVIRDWLERNFTLNWPTGKPPKVKLVQLGEARFRLIK
jgi:hypothetical protein